MKNKILTFIIGILTGAIIMTLVFIIFNKPDNDNNMGNIHPSMNGQMQRPEGNMGEPPEKPKGNMQMPTR
ncbi:MAG: hypothetical protein E7168_04170 [Firmicutes bacterium]|nr:hypothetical protein [Bacillota bacterium]